MKTLILTISAMSLAFGASACGKDSPADIAKVNRIISTLAPVCGKPNTDGYRQCLAFAKVRYAGGVEMAMITGVSSDGRIYTGTNRVFLPSQDPQFLQVEKLNGGALAEKYLAPRE